VGVHQRRAAAFAAPGGGLLHGAVRSQKIRAVHFQAEQAGKPATSFEMLPPAVWHSMGTEMA
jgi:hypothetical protein